MVLFTAHILIPDHEEDVESDGIEDRIRADEHVESSADYEGNSEVVVHSESSHVSRGPKRVRTTGSNMTGYRASRTQSSAIQSESQPSINSQDESLVPVDARRSELQVPEINGVPIVELVEVGGSELEGTSFDFVDSLFISIDLPEYKTVEWLHQTRIQSTALMDSSYGTLAIPSSTDGGISAIPHNVELSPKQRTIVIRHFCAKFMKLTEKTPLKDLTNNYLKLVI